MTQSTHLIQHPLFKVALAILSGMLLALSWPPAPSFFLLFIGFVPLLILRDLLGKGVRSLVVYALLTSIALLIWNSYTTYWIYKTFFTSGVVVNCINVTLFVVPWILYFSFQRKLNRYQQYGLLVSSWISIELLNYYWGLAFPYLTLGNVLASVPSLAQWYEYTGVFGGSLWIWVINLIFYDILRDRLAYDTFNYVLIRKLSFAVFWISIPVIFSLLIFSSYESRGKFVDVLAVHPDMNCHKERQLYTAEQSAKIHWDLTRQHLTSDTHYILWPENALNLGWLEELSFHPQVQAIQDSLKRHPNTYLITGAILYEQYQPLDTENIPVNTRYVDSDQVWYNTYNSALQFSNTTEVQMRTKIHLAPLEETTVYPLVVNFFRRFIPSLGNRSFSTRSSNKDIFVGNTDVATMICYESLFGYTVKSFVRKGADLLFVVLNEGWMDDDQQAQQFMQYASLRAIENRRSIVRSSNKGATCFIDQRGAVQQSFISKTATAIVGKAQVNKKITFYTMTGDYIAWIAVAVFGFYIILLAVSLTYNKLLNGGRHFLLKQAA